eukprot:360911-Amphidinium_carterae.1
MQKCKLSCIERVGKLHGGQPPRPDRLQQQMGQISSGSCALPPPAPSITPRNSLHTLPFQQ